MTDTFSLIIFWLLKMVIFQAFEDGIEVNGQTINTITDGLKSIRFLIEKYFEQAGLPIPGAIEENKWYSQQSWLDVFKTISEKIGPNAMFKIGKKIPENAEFPPEIDSIEKALESIDIAYHMNHRNKNGEILFDQKSNTMYEGIGHYGYEKKENENKIIMRCENPYDCDFDRGIITTQANLFNPTAVISHDDTQDCRKNGKDSCTYIIEWK